MTELILLWTILIFTVFVAVSHIKFFIKYEKLRKHTESEYYIDYVYKTQIMRVFKNEFEFQAIGNIERGKLLDTGALNPFYRWALIER